MDPNNGPLCQIRLLEDGGGSVCGGSVGAGTHFCMIQEPECKTALQSNTSEEAIIRTLAGNGQGYWVFRVPPSARDPKLAYFQPFIPQEVTYKGGGF